MSGLGIALVAFIDVVAPLGFGSWLVAVNYRRRRSSRTEVKFWLLASPLAIAVTVAVIAIIAVPRYAGGPVYPAVFWTLPGSLVPVIFTIVISGTFFDDETWASIGYFVVIPAFLIGCVLWEAVLLVGLRRLRQSSTSLVRRGRIGSRP